MLSNFIFFNVSTRCPNLIASFLRLNIFLSSFEVRLFVPEEDIQHVNYALGN